VMTLSLVRGVHNARHRWHLFHSGQRKQRGTTRRARARALRLLVMPVLALASLLTVVGGHVLHDLQRAAASPSERLLAAGGTTPTPTGSPMLDQEQPVFTGGLSVRRGASQTITVGLAGALVRVDL